ncbi:tRNA pseudouridine(38-40) synthase TruA [Gilvimarinus polysaccharolyticus]|uniref:tRNA pseudouridine(38-40) synthase TruA n=1 Tax=Gilvimarinus polysaccharolyticus TaxID=863921 RepID=UPI0006739EAE|nr:tRNA pseudouridine(38-40) synthase TruA [Gilvimarinus polysaccharolyticus]
MQERYYTRNCEISPGTPWPEGMQRVALGVEYNGRNFHGFQLQPGGVATVQGYLQQALSKVANEPISLVCAGRTDAGVHATGQVVHFDTLATRPAKAWMLGARPHLPDGVGVCWAQLVTNDFHARFSARSRAYRYLLSDSSSRPALLHDQVTWVRHKLDVDAMAYAAQALVGEHDFTSYRASQCQARSPVRCIEHLHLSRRGDLIILEVKANAFLHHMVRNIVGALLEVGRGARALDWPAEILAARDRSAGAATARPNGLYLVAVDYPSCFGLMQNSPGPLFIADPVGELAGRVGYSKND